VPLNRCTVIVDMMAKDNANDFSPPNRIKTAVRDKDPNENRDAHFWDQLEGFNRTPSKERGEVLSRIGIGVTNGELGGILTKSHFVIPGKTRFQCQMCGECCRYARKVANFTYEPCLFLTEQNRCSKHDSNYLVCRWFPFYVHHDPKYGDLLTIKPYCSGFGKGPLVDYHAKVKEINDLAESMRINKDGAFVIHEVLYLPEKGEWTFPSRKNLDILMRYLSSAAKTGGRAEKAHRSAELDHAQHFTSGLLGSRNDPQLTVDEEGHITDLNTAMEALCQKNRDVLMESRLDALFINPVGLQQAIKMCLARGKVTGSPHRLALSSGETVPVLLNGITYRDRTDGLVHGALFCFEPINSSVFNEMMQSQRYARSLIEASLDALVFLDLDGTILDVNDATVRIVGKERESLIGSDFADYFTDPQRARNGILETLERGMVQNFELTLMDKDSNRIPVQFNATAYRDHEGAIKGVFAAARDVRETKSMIAELEDAKDYSRGLIESSLDMMVTVDSGCLIMDVNEAATLLVGRSRDELIGASFIDLFNDRERAGQGVQACFSKGSVHNFELNVHNELENIPVSFNASVYRDRSGVVKGIFCIARDVRDRNNMVREIEEARNYSRGLIECSPDMMLTVNRKGLIMDVNEEGVRWTSKSRAALIGTRFDSHFVDPAKATEGVEMVFSTGKVRDYRLDLQLGNRTEPLSFDAGLYQENGGGNQLMFAIARKVAVLGQEQKI
jgi:PAS domain S-box-containing protein